jgi:CubicO group peptidase (beta-lactamase class C family)
MMSLAKVFSAVATLQVLQSAGVDLDAAIGPWLPPDWTQGPGIARITFRELLTHRSGLRSNGSTDTASLRESIARGVAPQDRGSARYDNQGFALLRLLLPYLGGLPEPGPAARDQATARWYRDYLRQHVFAAVGIGDADCRPWGGDHNALFYGRPPLGPQARGSDAGDWSLRCGGGGWTLTPADLHRFLLSLQNDQRILTESQKRQMDQGCLGWDCSVAQQRDYLGKDGAWHDDQGRAEQMYLGLFHRRQLALVLVVNSPPPEDLAVLVDRAYAASWVAR